MVCLLRGGGVETGCTLGYAGHAAQVNVAHKQVLEQSPCSSIDGGNFHDGVGGKNADIWAEKALHELARVGRAAGYDAIETKARLGWMRLAKKHNFRPKHVAYEMDLT